MFHTLTVSSAEQVKNEPGGRAAWRLSDTLGYTYSKTNQTLSVAQDKSKKVTFTD